MLPNVSQHLLAVMLEKQLIIEHKRCPWWHGKIPDKYGQGATSTGICIFFSRFIPFQCPLSGVRILKLNGSKEILRQKCMVPKFSSLGGDGSGEVGYSSCICLQWKFPGFPFTSTQSFLIDGRAHSSDKVARWI